MNVRKLVQVLGVRELTPAMETCLADLIELELGRIANGERGERLEHDTTRAGKNYREGYYALPRNTNG